MKYCKKCSIKILDEVEYCPLCRNVLHSVEEMDLLDKARIRLLQEDEKKLDGQEAKLRKKREELETACKQRDRKIQTIREERADHEIDAKASKKRLKQVQGEFRQQAKENSLMSRGQLRMAEHKLERRRERREGGLIAYPNVVIRQRKYAIVLRALVFAALLVSSLSLLMDHYFNHSFSWSLTVLESLLFMAWMLYLFYQDLGYMRRIFGGVFGGLVSLFLIDLQYGLFQWSFTYSYPIAVLLIELSLLILMLVNRRNWESYLIVQILMLPLGFLGMVFYWLGLAEQELLSEISFLLPVLVFLGTLLLGGRRALAELHRRFHI